MDVNSCKKTTSTGIIVQKGISQNEVALGFIIRVYPLPKQPAGLGQVVPSERQCRVRRGRLGWVSIKIAPQG